MGVKGALWDLDLCLLDANTIKHLSFVLTKGSGSTALIHCLDFLEPTPGVSMALCLGRFAILQCHLLLVFYKSLQSSYQVPSKYLLVLYMAKCLRPYMPENT